MTTNSKITLLLGGARSGKSTFAQKIAEESGKKVLFVATGEPLDSEMHARIEEHKKNRPESWETLETPCRIGKALREQKYDAEVVIIDCITLLVSNLLRDHTDYYESEKKIISEIDDLIDTMLTIKARFIIVSNEVGLGLVPDNALGRTYRDLLGKTNQLLAQHADEVYFLVAGIPVKIKDG